MQEIGKQIYVNFKPKLPHIKSKTRVRAFEIGTSGGGQTTLFNNMCRTKHKTGITKDNITKEI